MKKRFKHQAAATSISDTFVITEITALEFASIVSLTTGIGMPIIIVLASTGLFLGLGSAVIHKTQKVFDAKAKKHDKIKPLAESKLESAHSQRGRTISEDETRNSHQIEK